MPELLPPELVARLERLELVTRKIFRGRLKGERRSPRKGQSVEFADYRAYVPGDDLRFIDWNLYARLDRLFLKIFLEEEDLHFYALLDASRSMDFGDPTKLHYAKQIAAALGFVGLCRSDRVRVATLGIQAASAPALRGRHEVRRLLECLERIEPGENVSLREGVRRFCLANRGRGIVMLLSDLLDKEGFESALRFLAGRRMDVYVVHILSPEEWEPALVGDLRLVDSEDEDVAEVSISRSILRRYQQTVRQFCTQVRDFCARRDLVYCPLRTDQPVETWIASYLRQRGLVR